jgi:protein-S-isoprenylcysteine O-methyltransferase Ste14
MENKMTRWGVGPTFARISAVYALLILALNRLYFPALRFTLFAPVVNVTAGILLIAVGITLFLLPAFRIDDYFYKGKLCTTGVYAFVRHPIYAAWITGIIPGVVLIRGSILGISIPLVMYLVFRILIIKEEAYLAKKFGEEYQAYRRRVGAVFPKFRT